MIKPRCPTIPLASLLLLLPVIAFELTIPLDLPGSRVSRRQIIGIPAAQAAVPASLQPCIRQLNTNRTPIKVPFTRGTYREGARTYYLLHLFPPGMGFGVRDAIVSSQSSRCQVLAQYPSGQPIPVNALIPLSVARGLTLNILKSDIAKLGGPQRYQRILNSASQDTGRLYLDPNKVWALQQLGIRISPSIKILPPPPL